MLTFVGLGLYDERSVTLAGRDAIRGADRAFAEFYTGRLAGATVADLEASHGVDVEVRDRPGVEEDPEPILAAAEAGDAVFLSAGDPMVATTHVDLRLRAAERGIETRVVHGTSAETAAASLSGLQNYRFGKATTLPFPRAHGARAPDTAGGERTGAGSVPDSVLETVAANRERGLHTLVFLDIEAGTGPSNPGPDHEAFLTADRAAAMLGDHLAGVGVAIARAGGPDPVVAADSLSALAERSFGEPLHLLVLPGDLHVVEHDALVELAGAPSSALPDPA
jgi:diphthine synthase